MKIFTRHLGAELGKSFLIAMAVLTLLILIGGLFREAMWQGLPARPIIRLIPYVLPDAIRISLPVSVLLSVVSVYGRMAGHSEVVATKALGISPMVLLWPALAAAFVLSLATVWLNDIAVTWGRAGVRRVVVEAVEEIAYNMLESKRSYSSPEFSINVADVRGRTLIDAVISMQSAEVEIQAKEAELTADHETGYLKVTLRDSVTTIKDSLVQIPSKEPFEFTLPLQEVSRQSLEDNRPSCLALSQIDDQLDVQRLEIERYKEKLAARAGRQMVLGDFAALGGKSWARSHGNLRHMQSKVARLKTEPHRRLSAGFSCLCFALVGAPMALLGRRSDFISIFFLCFLPILVIYYPLLAFGINGAKSGSVPPWSVWAGNLCLALWSVYPFKRVMRY